MEKLSNKEMNQVRGGEEYRKTKPGQITEKSIPDNWENFPTQSPICSGDDGLSSKLDGITFPKWRNESIKAYGNAIVPQVVFEIFKAIELSEDKVL
jgi:DNA (cytosine-5)-methyltransferase 1